MIMSELVVIYVLLSAIPGSKFSNSAKNLLCHKRVVNVELNHDKLSP